jgi:predicted deacylase
MIRGADYLIDLHTGGNAMQLAPLVGYALHEDAGVLQAQRRMAKAFNLPLVWGTSGKLPGRTLSVARDANVPAIYAEWMGAGVCNPAGVDDYFQGCLNVLAELDMIDRESPASRIERIAEDARDNSGHLQLNYPAPMNGFFEAAVALGDELRPGDIIGTISDVLGECVQTITSTQSGPVICLRVFARVLAGDSLAVVLDNESILHDH